MTARDDYPMLAWLLDPTGLKPSTMIDVELERALGEIDRLRAARDAWMNGVADAVEPFGYDREAACGPADLLPGLVTLVEALRLAQAESDFWANR